jgi:uncharacterized protein (DUF2235 family)
MKRIVICCDGTWNRADQEHDGTPCPTNVVKLAYRVAKRDAQGNPQVVFYNQGVGTGNRLDRATGGAFGHGLEDNILDAYRFLIGNYEEGDELFLFGFSRGAFTARSLGGMIRNCGILRRDAIGQYRVAVELYRSRGDHPNADRSREFREACSIGGGEDIPIKFIGVWDTVGSLGIPVRGLRFLTLRRYQFHDTELSGTVENAFHALAVDEYRSPFEPTLWERKVKPGQRVRQVWFTGAHSDVGGGYADARLSDIPLMWMLEMANACGLELDARVIEAHPLNPDPMLDPHISKTGVYRATRDFLRPIGVELDRDGNATEKLDTTQDLHPTVRERWDADAGYRPRQLRRYFELAGDPRGSAA